MDAVSERTLAVVARALSLTGHVVVVRYDDEVGQLAFYVRPEYLSFDVHPPAGPPAAEGAPPPVTERPATGDYEDEGSQRLTTGSVSVAAGAWWSATLSRPEPVDPVPPGGAVFLRLERHGSAPADYRGDLAVDLCLPATELDHVITLLSHLVTRARRDGVLPSHS